MFCCIINPITVSLFIKSPGCREEEFSHTVTANSNPLRQKEKEPFEVPDISLFWNLFQGCFRSPQSFLRITPYIWVTPEAIFVLHPPCFPEKWKWEKSSKESWTSEGEKNRSAEGSSNRRRAVFIFQPPSEAHSSFCPWPAGLGHLPKNPPFTFSA